METTAVAVAIQETDIDSVFKETRSLLVTGFFYVHLYSSSSFLIPTIADTHKNTTFVSKFNKLQMMKTLTQVFHTVVLLVVSFSFFACSNVAQKYLETAATQFNKQCPKQLNEFVRMDKCEAAPDLTLKFTATILSIDSENIDFQQSIVSKGAKKMVIQTLQADSNFDKIKKFGIKYQYSYVDSNGKHLYDVLVTPDDYNNPLSEDSDEEILTGMIEGSKLEVQSMQKMLPIDLGNGVAITAIRFFEKELIYEYTCTLHDATEDVAKEDPDAFVSNSKPVMVNSFKNDPVTSNYLSKGFTYRYIYIDSKGNNICKIDITKNDI